MADSTHKLPGHIPALDGLRGLAIILVMICHFTVLDPHTRLDSALLGLAKNGWIGVDLFFVLSGFLITGILFDAKGSDGFFRNFYARRTLRIFPLYYAVVFVTLVVLPRVPLGIARDYGRLDGSPAWYWFYLSNFHQAHLHHYSSKVLGVSWSLAIEEQFYLLWPAVVFLFSRKALMRIAAGLVMAGIASRVLAIELMQDPSAALYMLTPCRMDGLAIGAFVALWLRRPVPPVSSPALSRSVPVRTPALLVVFILAMLATILLFTHDLVVGGRDLSQALLYFTLNLACGALLLLVLAARRGSLITMFFEAPLPRAFGRYSYALYLFHLPIATLLHDHGLAPARFPTLAGSELPGQLIFYLIATAIALAAAMASWNLFERHFLKLKRLFPTRHQAGGGVFPVVLPSANEMNPPASKLAVSQ
jgi:peptidoglycan/LPS O-acetylase OafA/YrhL